MKPIITIPEADLLAILGENGERWAKGTWGNGEGSVCLHGAIRRCQPQPGDAFLIQHVAHACGWGTGWNDDRATSWPMVRARLAQVEITDVDLADTFGPQWAQIVALVRRAAVLTPDEAKRLAAGRRDACSTDAAWAVSAAARPASRVAAWAAARPASRAASRAAAWAAAGAAADAADVAADAAVAAAATGTAARALAVRHLIGHHNYNLLTGPWRTVIGAIHPDDPEVE